MSSTWGAAHTMSQERWTIWVDGNDVYTKELPNFTRVEVVPVRALEAALEEARELREAAEWLLRLKDGPRDEKYRAEKDAAWEALRSALVSGGRE